MSRPLRIVVLGLSVTSSWGNGHATTYRSLLKAMARRGHEIVFLERDMPWYAAARDFTSSPFFDIRLYQSVDQLRDQHGTLIKGADAVVLGSYLPDGIALAGWIQMSVQVPVAFYDIDTPITLRDLEDGCCRYLSPSLIAGFDLYLSFAGGPVLSVLKARYGARRARALYCSVDTDLYHPVPVAPRFDLGYLGTYSADRQPTVERFLLAPARALQDRQFILAGPQYPNDIAWPANVARQDHVAPHDHARFYVDSRFTLNVTRQSMIAAGWSPSVRLFEAAACGVPIISDDWPGLNKLFRPGAEILIAHSTDDVVAWLQTLSEAERHEIGQAARARVLAEHSADRRAAELEQELISAGAARLQTSRAAS